MGTVGKSVVRVDALSKVTGEALYPGDISFPDQLHMKIRFAEIPHALVRSIDVSAAEALPGVIAVYTAKDVPNNEYGLIMPDQPVLCGPGSTKPFGDRVRFVGDQIAVVVAESDSIAENACALIQVDYEELPVVTDPLDAMDEKSPRLHPDRDSNVVCHYRVRKGDTETAFSTAAVIVEDEYRTPVQEHAYLQPEAGVGYIDEEGRITITVAGQWTHEDQEQIAHALDLELDEVRVVYPAIGGAFGGREDMSVQIVLALAVMRLNEQGITKPVKIVWSREESIIGHHKRHPYIIRSRWGADNQGKIVAAKVEVISDSGAYAYTSTKVLGNATLMSTGPYDIPNVHIDAYSVYTNNIPNGAFRGFGGPQAAYSAESQVNKLADKLGIDVVEMRMRNLFRDGSIMSVGTPLPKGVSLPQVVESCALTAGWLQENGKWQRPNTRTKQMSATKKRGLGFACSYKNVGFSFGAPEQCTAIIELHGAEKIEEAVVRHAASEVGQGVHTAIAQMAAEALGLSMDRIRLVTADTAYTSDSGSVSASRMTFMAGNAIRGAAELAQQRWDDEDRPAVASYTYRPPATTPFDPKTGKSEPNFAYGYVAETVEVEVDTETGAIEIVNVICSDDVGRAVNPQQVQGQVEGAIVQAAGYALMENFISVDGLPQTRHLSTYLIPTVLDIPDQIQSVILEYPDPIGPWGARGMGEMPYLPLTPAITAAVYDAVGVWFNEFPLTPETILRGLGKVL